MKTFFIFSPEDVAKALMVILEKGTNGSVWIAEGKEPPYEILLSVTAKL